MRLHGVFRDNHILYFYPPYIARINRNLITETTGGPRCPYHAHFHADSSKEVNKMLPLCRPLRHTRRVELYIVTLILNLNTRWVVTFTLRPLYPRYRLNRRLGGFQSLSKLFGKRKKNLLPQPGFEPRTVQPITWSLRRLSSSQSGHACFSCLN